MKITKIELPKSSVDRLLNSARCSKVVGSTGTRYFGEPNDRCGRFAKFNIDGKQLCTQHAGEAALLYLIQEQNDE